MSYGTDEASVARECALRIQQAGGKTCVGCEWRAGAEKAHVAKCAVNNCIV